MANVIPNGCNQEAIYVPAPDPCSGGCVLETLNVTEDGTYTPPSGVDGFDNVIVETGGDTPRAFFKVGASNPIIKYGDNVYGVMSAPNTDYIIPTDSEGNEIKLDLSQPFEIGVRFKLTAAPGSYGNAFGSLNSYYHCPSMCVRPNKLSYYVSTNGSSWQYNDIAMTPSDYTPPINLWITFRLAWDGTDFTFYADDGTNEYTATLEGVTPYYNANYRFEFGGQNRSSYSISNSDAYIDFAHTYLKQNGQIVWGRSES